MANFPSKLHMDTGVTLYAVFVNASDQWWDVAGTPEYETALTSAWADYATAATETPASSYQYRVVVPATLTVGYVWVRWYLRVTGAALITDTPLGQDLYYWDGTAIQPLASNVMLVGGSEQSQTDLKDFADAGYDPATNKVTGVLLTDTVTTYTGNTKQTGNNYTRIGAPVGASISADLADVPTVAEFEARTLVAASYFDPAADTVAQVTLVDTVTDITNGVTIANGAITAAVIATDAIDADALATSAVTEIVGGMSADGVGYADIMESLLAVGLGVSTETAGTMVFKSRDGATTKVTVVHDELGNRSSSTIAP